MSNHSASLRLRPTRIGFLVRPANLDVVRLVMQVCTCLWGGMYNPIIPVCDDVPDAWKVPLPVAGTGYDLTKGYIRFFEPDVFVETEAGLAAKAGIKAGNTSKSGRITEQVLNAVGGLHGCYLLADKKTLQLLDNMSKSVRIS